MKQGCELLEVSIADNASAVQNSIRVWIEANPSRRITGLVANQTVAGDIKSVVLTWVEEEQVRSPTRSYQRYP